MGMKVGKTVTLAHHAYELYQVHSPNQQNLNKTAAAAANKTNKKHDICARF